MIYLSGATSYATIEARHPNIGFMMTPHTGYRPKIVHGRHWGADTGRFASPHEYDDEKYLTWLSHYTPHLDTCLFATAPDVVGDAATTLALSLPMLPRIRQLGIPAALVAQDGLEHLEIPWDAFDCLFVGGTTDWKLSEAAYQLADEANQRGKWTHMGRVNSKKRLTAAANAGYDSTDGTHIRYRPSLYIHRLTRWLSEIESTPPLQLKENA